MCVGAETCEHSPPAVDRVRLGSQAFHTTTSFSANIGAWNIASVTSLYMVCAASGPGGAHYGGTRSAGL